MGYFICPYCVEEMETPEECPDPSETYQHECEHCEKNFVFSIDYDIIYSEEKADCLNGGEHIWTEICGSPKEYFKNRRRCSHCNDEKTFSDEELKAQRTSKESGGQE